MIRVFTHEFDSWYCGFDRILSRWVVSREPQRDIAVRQDRHRGRVGVIVAGINVVLALCFHLQEVLTKFGSQCFPGKFYDP